MWRDGKRKVGDRWEVGGGVGRGGGQARGGSPHVPV